MSNEHNHALFQYFFVMCEPLFLVDGMDPDQTSNWKPNNATSYALGGWAYHTKARKWSYYLYDLIKHWRVAAKRTESIPLTEAITLLSQGELIEFIDHDDGFLFDRWTAKDMKDSFVANGSIIFRFLRKSARTRSFRRAHIQSLLSTERKETKHKKRAAFFWINLPSDIHEEIAKMVI